MKQKLTPRWFIIKLAGILFAVYSVYNVFIIVRDGEYIPTYGIAITAVVAGMFALLAAFSWTSEFKDIRFLNIRKAVFIVSLVVIFALKLRMINQVIAYLDFSKVKTIVYCGAYFMTLAALLVLFFYYAIVVRNLPLFPKASVILPLFALLLFLGSFVLEIVLFYKYGVGLEANPLRTMVIRPVFYMGFISLSVYFLLPPKYAVASLPI